MNYYIIYLIYFNKIMDLFTRHSNNLKQNVNIIESVSSLSELAILGD